MPMKISRRSAILGSIATLFAGRRITSPRKLYDLYISPNTLRDIRAWGVYQIDEQTRKEIYNAGGLDKMISVGYN